MPQFRSTRDIFVTPDQDEVFDPNWMDSDKLILPPKADWDYAREMQTEDVDIWEVIHESGVFSLYASWSPYAEFYLFLYKDMFTPRKWGERIVPTVQTFYGANASNEVYRLAKDVGIQLTLYTHWVEPENMWLYQPKEVVDLIL